MEAMFKGQDSRMHLKAVSSGAEDTGQEGVSRLKGAKWVQTLRILVSLNLLHPYVQELDTICGNGQCESVCSGGRS